MKVIELFAGSRSIGKAAEQLGLDVWSKIPHDLCKEVLISAMLTSVGWHK